MAQTERDGQSGKTGKREADPSREGELSQDEVKEIEEHTWLPAPMIYQIIRQEGSHELARPATSLWWSGLAGGMLIGLSILGEAILHTHLPDAAWRPLVENFGYCFGFLESDPLITIICLRHLGNVG